MKNNLDIYKGTFFELFTVTFSAAAIAVLSAINTRGRLAETVIFAFVFAGFFLIQFLLTILILSLTNSQVKKKYGKGFIYGSVLHGYMLLFPFMIVFFLTDVLLKWNSPETIVAVSIITSAAYSTSDLIKLGGNKYANLIISFTTGIIFMYVFLILFSLHKLF